jgi:hypothetical protein
MLRSRVEGDEEQFYSIALQVAASEARQGRRTTADELRAAVDEARVKNARGPSVAIPFARPRGELENLIDLKATRLQLSDVILQETLCKRLEDITRQQQKREWLREHDKRPTAAFFSSAPLGREKR